MIKVPISLAEDSMRLETKKVLTLFTQVLIEEYNVPMKEIVTEMLLFSSKAIADEDIKISASKSNSFDYENDAQEDEVNSYELACAKDDLKFIKSDISEFKRDFKRGDIHKWQISNLRERIENLSEDFSRNKLTKFSNELNKIKVELEPIFEEAEIFCAESEIKGCADKYIHNVRSIQSIITSIEDASMLLEQKNVLSEELKEIIRLTKERCAKYRAQKKMLEAEIAENSGNTKKTDKLKAEANALLMQDWRLIVKSENCPDVGCL